MENSSPNKKKELMEEAGLWALLTDRLSLHSPSLTTALYTALFELMTQSQVGLKIIVDNLRFENKKKDYYIWVPK